MTSSSNKIDPSLAFASATDLVARLARKKFSARAAELERIYPFAAPTAFRW